MARRREEQEEHAEGTERWLLTYSDMITLLLTLFIVLYSMSNVDLDKYKTMAQNLGIVFNAGQADSGQTNNTGKEIDISSVDISTAAIGGNITADGESAATTDGEGTAGAAGEAAAGTNGTSGANTGSGNPGTQVQDSADMVYTELEAYIKQNDLEAAIDVEKTDTYIKISLKDAMLFYADSAKMVESSKPILEKIGQALIRIYDGINHITISGHTASTSNDSNTSNNVAWELSTSRAVTVLNYLADIGLPEKKLSIEGYSHFDPVAPNDTEANRAKNRRVEIKILKLTKEDTAGDTTP